MTRKGAIAVYLEPWHQDIDDFIDIKKNSGEERRRAHDIFPALWIPDIFMERVLVDGDWTLFDPYDVPLLKNAYGSKFEKSYLDYELDTNIKKIVVRAKDLWKKILTSYYEVGSPFLCWKDTANRANPNKHKGVIRSSNLCTEIFQNTSPNHYMVKVYVNNGDNYLLFEETDLVYLNTGKSKLAKFVTSLDTLESHLYTSSTVDITDYKQIQLKTEIECKVWCVEKEKIDGKTAVCNLGSVNLAKINTKEDMERVVPIAVEMLDIVIDLNYYPLLKVKQTNMASRSIGLGVMGEAEYLANSRIHFGSQEHIDAIDCVMECFSYNVIKASSELGKIKGNYPDFEGSEWSKNMLPFDYTRDEVMELTTNKYIGNSYSLEEWAKLRKMACSNMRNGYLMAIAPTSSISILVGTTQAIEPVYKRKWYEENLSGLIPVVAPKLSVDTWEFYKPAHEVDQKQLIKVAAIRQKWIDQGQSVNIFMAIEKASGKYLHELYTLAWKLGLKSTYYLRSQSAEASKADDRNIATVDRSIECEGCQ